LLSNQCHLIVGLGFSTGCHGPTGTLRRSGLPTPRRYAARVLDRTTIDTVLDLGDEQTASPFLIEPPGVTLKAEILGGVVLTVLVCAREAEIARLAPTHPAGYQLLTNGCNRKWESCRYRNRRINPFSQRCVTNCIAPVDQPFLRPPFHSR